MNKKYLFMTIIIVLLNLSVFTNEYYGPQFFSYYKNLYMDIISDIKIDKSSPVISGTIEKKRTMAVFTGKIEKIEKNEFTLFKNWEKSFYPDMQTKTSLYKNKIEVIENNEKYQVLFQENLEKYLQKDGVMIIHYYYIGYVDNKPLFVCFTFED